MDQQLFESLEWRNIGPHRAGRVVCCAGDPDDRETFYFGSCGGGVWKTTDGGAHWFNVSDGYFNTAQSQLQMNDPDRPPSLHSAEVSADVVEEDFGGLVVGRIRKEPYDLLLFASLSNVG